MDTSFVKSYTNFICMLVSARPEYLSLVLGRIAQGLTLRMSFLCHLYQLVLTCYHQNLGCKLWTLVYQKAPQDPSPVVWCTIAYTTCCDTSLPLFPPAPPPFIHYSLATSHTSGKIRVSKSRTYGTCSA